MSGRIALSEIVVVEGRYDKIKLETIFDALIVETDGFQIFHDEEKMDYLKRLAAERGAVILTDSDAAGFKIRTYLTEKLKGASVRQVYIPDITGKEKRKSSPSKEGKLGVEGMEKALLIDALCPTDAVQASEAEPITRMDLYELGLMGGPDSAPLRRQLLTALGLPARLSVTRMLGACAALFDRQTVLSVLERVKEERR